MFGNGSQVTLVGTQVWWATEVNIAFARLEEGYENAMKEYVKKHIGYLITPYDSRPMAHALWLTHPMTHTPYDSHPTTHTPYDSLITHRYVKKHIGYLNELLPAAL